MAVGLEILSILVCDRRVLWTSAHRLAHKQPAVHAAPSAPPSPARSLRQLSDDLPRRTAYMDPPLQPCDLYADDCCVHSADLRQPFALVRKLQMAPSEISMPCCATGPIDILHSAAPILIIYMILQNNRLRITATGPHSIKTSVIQAVIEWYAFALAGRLGVPVFYLATFAAIWSPLLHPRHHSKRLRASPSTPTSVGSEQMAYEGIESAEAAKRASIANTLYTCPSALHRSSLVDSGTGPIETAEPVAECHTASGDTSSFKYGHIASVPT
ncbi:hypothetical protein PCANC_28194 [Puccinia coronata f. sp. avenae]|uniref:Uncharacterized protein n=1 Tax=Puccinia coronata f. sp. avenae TaxID=200324 RepID=A0A2N5RXH4_9BASI|nr:hypothetical protein PCANC_28194 [Puccinia coronata f. sp. avenae]